MRATLTHRSSSVTGSSNRYGVPSSLDVMSPSNTTQSSTSGTGTTTTTTTTSTTMITTTPPPSTTSTPSRRHNNNHHHSTSSSSSPFTYVSTKEKDAFNARLVERRKQRRAQRLVRRQRLHESIVPASAYKSKHFVLILIIMIVVILGWFIGFIWIAMANDDATDQTTNNNRNGNSIDGTTTTRSSPFRLIEQAAGNHRIQFLRDAIHNVVSKTKKLGGKSTKGGQQQRHHDIEVSSITPNDVKDAIIHLKGNTNEVVDMRVLNMELPFDNVNGGAWTQGWDVQPISLDDPNRPLHIYVVPHSHCDPGWIKTFDEYFQSETKQILTSVVRALHKDPRRKFIWAEISYFEWWWKEQDETTRAGFKQLLRNHQFEFVTGGWVQPDEANTQLYAMEIQLQEGHDFIRHVFGEEYIPKFGWSIDPFGYSPTMAYLLKNYGFQGMLIQRVHYAVKKELALHKRLEFMWRQTWDVTGDHDIFTHVMPFYSYDVPHTCGPDPSICCQFDFARLGSVASYVGNCPWKKQPKIINDRNVAERAMLLLDQYRKKAALYRTNVVLAPLGDDFRYRTLEEADVQYENYQRIFDYINENVPNVRIQFGTLSDYFQFVLVNRPFDPPLLKGSFFTYSDREEDYWSGYFTSRIFDKALDRQLERVLYAATSMGATKDELRGPRRALSLFQHHDGVTGTAKDEVVEDYAKRIHTAIREVQDWMVDHLVPAGDSATLLKELNVGPCWQSTAPRGLSQNLCQSTNTNVASDTKNDIIVYNPLPTEQYCGSVMVPGRTIAHATLPCEVPGPTTKSSSDIQFDQRTGLMVHPIREEWMVWNVVQGGAYLFFPGTLTPYNELELDVQLGGYIVTTKDWSRKVVVRDGPDDGSGATIIDFIYETNLQKGNEEWFARFTAEGLQNGGVFHTDLNGYNFDTHHFRSDMPIQSQVFPMPTLASIEDGTKRLTVLSEHAQGTASLEEGSIDVWLDRRLMQDDNRGLAQGVMDNVPTRTRLRVVIETTGYNHQSPEFSITPLCKRQWKELNHPLEMFGPVATPWTKLSQVQLDNSRIKKFGMNKGVHKLQPRQFAVDKTDGSGRDKGNANPLKYRVPVVFLVYKRPDYFKQAIEYLRKSDYPKDSLPIIVSHDGHVKEMVDYVESIKSEFRIIQLFHPYAYSEHPNTFPGDDPKLNEGYAGDTYGNKRDGKVCALKHHFTWMINEVFGLDEVHDADGFLLMEEDYVVAPTFYETIQNGFGYIDDSGRRDDFFGVTLDPTEGYNYNVPQNAKGGWLEKKFMTGPMAIRRDMFARIKANAKEYCNWDDYNWDWSFVRLMAIQLIPYKVLAPSELQVAHIGLAGGLHHDSGAVQGKFSSKVSVMNYYLKNMGPFHAKPDRPYKFTYQASPQQKKGFGGWGHPADHDHCLKLFGSI